LLEFVNTSLAAVENVYVLDPTLDVKVVPFGITTFVTGVDGVILNEISAEADTNDLGV
jgi:hypothetical protein